MMVELKQRELREHPNVEPRAILTQALKKEGAETIPQGSTLKRVEARCVVGKVFDNFDNNDIVLSMWKHIAEDEMKCKICFIEKPIEDFAVCSKKGNGENYYRKICKPCQSKKTMEYNLNHVEAKNRNARNLYMNNRQEIIDKVKLYEKINPLRIISRNKINSEIRSGRIARNESCEICGKKCRTQGHHPDYTKPLEVIWMCVSCHKKLHLVLG